MVIGTTGFFQYFDILFIYDAMTFAREDVNVTETLPPRTSNFRVIDVAPITSNITIWQPESYENEELEQPEPTTEQFPMLASGSNPLAPQVIQRDGTMRIFTDEYAELAETQSNSDRLFLTGVASTFIVESLGLFELTAYCLCIICTEHYSYQHPRNASNPNFVQRTASGTAPRAGRTVAVDSRVIPFGSRLLINGQTYIAEDRGGAIQGNIIDIFKSDHQTAWNFGRREAEVFLIIE